MSCFYVSARLRVCSSRALSCLRALFCVGAWCSDPSTHVLSFGSCRGSDTRAPCSVSLCERAARVRSAARSCPRVLCVCVVLHAVSCFYRLRAFMLCLVLCGTQLMYFIGCVLSCCHVLCEHAAYECSH